MEEKVYICAMILTNFTEEMIDEEILKDLMNVLRYSDHQDKRFRKIVLRASIFPVHLSFFYTSPLKNKWFISYEARNKKEIGENCRMTIVCTYRDSNGFLCAAMPTSVEDKRHMIIYPAHFFTRYRERMNIEDLGDDLIKKFFTLNFSYVFEEKRTFVLNSNAFVKEIYGSCHDGVCMGVMTNMGNILFRTFITYGMAKGEQIKTFAENEKIRKEIHEKL